jgi:hypothetical protein
MSQPPPRRLPEHLSQHAPKREDYPDEEEYQEALAYYRHRFRHAAQPTKSPSKGSPGE